MASAVYAPFEAVAFTPWDEGSPFVLVLFDIGQEESFQLPLCFN